MADFLKNLTGALVSWVERGPTLPVILRLLRENARDYVWSYVLAFTFMGAAAVATGASAWIIRDIVNQIFVKRNGAMIWLIALVVVVIFAVKGFSLYLQALMMSRIGNNIVARNQKRLFRHVIGQDLHFFQRTSMSDLVIRVSYNANAAREVLDLIITSLGRDALSVVSLLVVMLAQDALTTIVAFLTMPIAVLGVATLRKKVRKITSSEFKSLIDIVKVMQETAIGVRIVKAFNLQDKMVGAMNRAVEQVETRANRIAAINASTSPLMETLGGFAVALIIAYGGYSVVYLGRDAGVFFSLIASVLLAYEPSKRLARVHLQLESSLVAVRMMYALLDEQPTLTERADARRLDAVKGRIRFENVTFRYDDVPAVEDLTLDFPAGKVSALIGPSGAGKSTVFSLIERFYDPNEGRITVDGIDLRDASLASLRDNIALVTQDTFLFQGSVRDNIADGRLGASDEAIIAAAKAANAHDFIMAMPNGYASGVGEGGTRLSGGQRQRVAIARAMLRDAPILLLDEATSALDSASEAMVQEALGRLMIGRTTIVIAHRLSTVRQAEMIHVLQKGRLEQSGSHNGLLAEGGVYAHLHALQFREPEEVG